MCVCVCVCVFPIGSVSPECPEKYTAHYKIVMFPNWDFSPEILFSIFFRYPLILFMSLSEKQNLKN